MARRPILLFDVMDTLVSEPYTRDVPAFLRMDEAEIYRLRDPQAYLDFEHGQIDERTFGQRFFVDRRPLDLEGLKAVMVENFAWLDGVEALLGELRALGYEMHALSNYSSWYRLIEAKLGLSRYLAWSFVSCTTGVRKPRPEAYVGAAAALGVEPSECLFVDDRKKNVEGAEAVGMPSILRRQDISSLRAALRARGLGV